MDAFDIYQHYRIRRTDDRIRLNESSNEHRHRRSRDEIDELHARIDRLMLINEAMWGLLCHVTGLTEEHLAHRMYELDSEDGAEDGRRQSQAVECSCGAKVHPKAQVCVFCGVPAPPGRSAFDAV